MITVLLCALESEAGGWGDCLLGLHFWVFIHDL